MDYKEKYEQGLECLEEILNSGQEKIKMTLLKERLLPFFPELKESEGERIRKALITFFQRFPYDSIEQAGTNAKEAIAWLEKQGKNNMGISEATKQKLEDNLNKALEKETPESCNEFLEKQGEQKPAEVRTTGYWNVQDIEQKPAWSEIDERIVESILNFYTYMRDEWVNWLKSLKDRVQPQQEWSEEEIATISRVISIVKWAAYSDHSHPILNDEGATELVERLKSLKDRYTWKPSEEQMDALRYVTNFDYGGHKATLVSLYEQLKKLKEVKL